MASKAQVPGQFINNWNAADPSKTSRTLHGLSPLPRKPATACEACRLAKAKCTGGEPCGRCSRRNIQCKYKHLADMTNLERQSTTSIPNKDTQHLFSDISVELQSALDGVQALPATFGQWEATFSLTPPEPNLFDSFEPPNETSVQSEKLPQDKSSGCFNLESMLSHLSGTLRPRTSVSAMGFDEILQTIETSLDVARNFVRCETCFKSSMELVSVALLLQRIASLFDFVAHGTVKKQAPNLGMGVYKLSAEDEIDFKRMVVSKLAKKAEQLLELLVGLAQELFGLGDHNSTWQDVTVPGLHLRNLSYVRDTSRDIKSCIQNAMGVVQARDWGLRQLVVD